MYSLKNNNTDCILKIVLFSTIFQNNIFWIYLNLNLKENTTLGKYLATCTTKNNEHTYYIKREEKHQQIS